MAITRQAQHSQYSLFGRPTKTGLDRANYLVRAHEFARRGADLPQTKLTGQDVARIRAMKEKRDRLREMITARYSNRAIAEIFGVHESTIEKALSWENHGVKVRGEGNVQGNRPLPALGEEA